MSTERVFNSPESRRSALYENRLTKMKLRGGEHRRRACRVGDPYLDRFMQAVEEKYNAHGSQEQVEFWESKIKNFLK